MTGLFDKLGLIEAIVALLDRLAIRKEDFLRLDAAARSRAFTMARVADRQVLEQIQDELAIAANNGETFADFKKRLAEVRERTGWTGTNDWHYRLVYDQNLSMAYTAGRYQQGAESGFSVVRILPTLSMEPRAEHAALAGKLFRVGPGSMLPPWDFNCACGWEWVFPEELEAMGKRPEDFEMLPSMVGSEFKWSTSAFLGASEKSEARNAMRNGHVVCCDAIAAPAATVEVLLVPWGHVQRKDGDGFVLDDEAAQMVMSAYRAGRTDLVIDFEHQSMGGRFASPDGTAPAAGWVKDLRIRPGKGIYGSVEWTERAKAMLAAKEYRYLSPVLLCEDGSGRVLELLNCGLTNEPMIAGFPALVNSVDRTNQDLLQGGTPMKLATQLRELLQLGQDASEEDILAKIKELAAQLQSGETGPAEGGAVIEALADLATGDLADAGGEEIAEAVNKRDFAAAAKGLRAVINRLRHPVDKVDKASYEALAEKVGKLEQTLADRELDELISVNSDRLTPAERDSFPELYAKDPEFARKWLANQPVKVNTRATASSPAGNPSANDRMAVINSARAKVQGLRAAGNAMVCDERTTIDGILAGERQARLTDEEAAKLGLEVAA